MAAPPSDELRRGFGDALLGNGSLPLAITGLGLIGAGLFALFLCAGGHFLPHDVAALGFDAGELARLGNRELVNFMFHDRAAFGGSLLAVGVLYLWLAEFPIRQGRAWGWWTFALTNVAGFGSFLMYLGYGYLDTWHAAATLLLLPLPMAGLARAWSLQAAPCGWRCLWPLRALAGSRGRERAARLLLAAYAAGLMLGGLTISALGMTRVFVDTDLDYIGLSIDQICGLSPNLVPVIAHDRAGFGGGLFATGMLVLLIVGHAPLTRNFLQALAWSGAVGFGATIGIHYLIGYTDPWHLAPAWVGAALWAGGTLMAWRAGRALTPGRTPASARGPGR